MGVIEMINFDNVKEIELELKRERNKLLRSKLRILRLKTVIKSHKEGIYNPNLYDELMKRSKEV